MLLCTGKRTINVYMNFLLNVLDAYVNVELQKSILILSFSCTKIGLFNLSLRQSWTSQLKGNLATFFSVHTSKLPMDCNFQLSPKN